MRWRERYEGLRLNTMRVFSTLPGYRFERRYGRYPRREDLVEYLDRYAAMRPAHHPLRDRAARRRGGWRRGLAPRDVRSAAARPVRGCCDRLRRGPEHAPLARKSDSFTARADPRLRLPRGCGLPRTRRADRRSGQHRDRHRGAPAGCRCEREARHAHAAEHLSSRLGSHPPPAAGHHGREAAREDLGRDRVPAPASHPWGSTKYGIPRAPEGYESRFRRTFTGPAVDDGFVAALKAAPASWRRSTASTGARWCWPERTRLRPDAVIRARVTGAVSSRSSVISACCAGRPADSLPGRAGASRRAAPLLRRLLGRQRGADPVGPDHRAPNRAGRGARPETARRVQPIERASSSIG